MDRPPIGAIEPEPQEMPLPLRRAAGEGKPQAGRLGKGFPIRGLFVRNAARSICACQIALCAAHFQEITMGLAVPTEGVKFMRIQSRPLPFLLFALPLLGVGQKLREWNLLVLARTRAALYYVP